MAWLISVVPSGLLITLLSLPQVKTWGCLPSSLRDVGISPRHLRPPTHSGPTHRSSQDRDSGQPLHPVGRRHHGDHISGDGHLGLRAPGRCDLVELCNLFFHFFGGGDAGRPTQVRSGLWRWLLAPKNG